MFHSFLQDRLSLQTDGVISTCQFCIQFRRGSGINTDRFPKRGPKTQALSKRVWGAGFPRNVLVFNSLSPLSWVFESLRQHIAQVSTWKVFFIIKNVFIMKNLTDFRKTVETGVDPRLQLLFFFRPTLSRLKTSKVA